MRKNTFLPLDHFIPIAGAAALFQETIPESCGLPPTNSQAKRPRIPIEATPRDSREIPIAQ